MRNRQEYWSDEVKGILSRYQLTESKDKQNHVEFPFAQNVYMEIVPSMKGYTLAVFWKDRENNRRAVGSEYDVNAENLPWMMEGIIHRYQGGLCVEDWNE